MLPAHGQLTCRRCFGRCDENIRKPHPSWRMVNDPGAWGGTTPKYLVLGFSKGATQAGIFAEGRFEDVAFASMRTRLTQALQAVGALSIDKSVDPMIEGPNLHIAFGSLVRCSVTRRDHSLSAKRGHDVYASSGNLIVKSFAEIPDVIRACADQFLLDLPTSVRAVLLLGNADMYVRHCQSLIQDLFPKDFKVVNEMAVYADGRLWIHLAHPSPANGHFNTWLNSTAGPGAKRLLAIEAISVV